MSGVPLRPQTLREELANGLGLTAALAALSLIVWFGVLALRLG
jgi:hypothetical protein